MLHTTLYRAVSRSGSGESRAKNRPANAFALVAASPYLSLLALLLVLLNIVNTTGEYILANLVTERATALAAATPGFSKGGLPQPHPVRLPYAFGIAFGDQNLLTAVNEWILSATSEGVVERDYAYWVLGEGAENVGPRWSILRNVLGWQRKSD